MSLIAYELRKALMPRFTKAALVGLLLINLLLTNYAAGSPVAGNSDVTWKDLDQIYTESEGIPPEELVQTLEVWMEGYHSLWQAGADGAPRQPSQDQVQALLTYTDNIKAEYELVQTVLEQANMLCGYQDYLDSVQNNAERLLSSTLFFNERSFSGRSVRKTADVYSHLKDVTVTVGSSSGIRLPLEGHTTTALLLFSVVLVVLNLALMEREEGLLTLIKPTLHGRGKTWWAKLWALALGILLLTGLFYGSNLILCAVQFRLGDLSRSIQSIEGYLTSPWPINVGEFLVWFLLVKYTAVLTVGLTFFLLCTVLRTRVLFCVACAGILMAELGMYVGISEYSWLSVFHYLNLAAILDTKCFFADYQNLNVFGWPVSVAASSGVFCLAICVGCGWTVHRSWIKEDAVIATPSYHARQFQAPVCTSLLYHEAYKLLACCKGSLLLLLLLAVQVLGAWNLAAYEGADEVWYRYYSSRLIGPYREENAQYLQEEQMYFNAIGEQQRAYLTKGETGELSMEYASYLAASLSPEEGREQGFQRVLTQYEFLQSQQEAGKTVYYLPTTGYDYLLDHRISDVLDAAKLCFVLAVCMSLYFTVEDTSGMILLIRPSPKGERFVILWKWIVCMVWLILACIAAFGPRIWVSLSIYPMEYSEYTAASLPQFQDAPENWRIIAWFVAVNLSRFAGALAGSLVIFCLSRLVRHHAVASIVGMLVLELPVVLYLLGVTGEWGVLPLSTGHWLLH